ncbi:hypothetical protein BDV23DRAFT_196235 [Aspergillus alliaceus]|uniref:Nucleoside phosphorylase domain-containing protein n=1 Tax=Petromyces alliaceus TaxID=209559 RepID=A0A5N7BYB6_PETAA|nr:hypothetical protein BDV23DRAFT_196235 [Aspergillus alliaceus]
MRPTGRDHFTISVLCALALEADADWKHNILLFYMPGTGKGSAASVSSRLQLSYPRIQLALLIGICEVAPRDVILSEVVVEYDFGQYDVLGRPGQQIRALLKALRATKRVQPKPEDIPFEAAYQHKHDEKSSTRCLCLHEVSEEACNERGCNESTIIRHQCHTEIDRPATHIGGIASVDTVVEGARIWDNTSRIVIKGVCDYAGNHKNESWQAYTAAAGASAAKAFLESWRSVSRAG